MAKYIGEITRIDPNGNAVCGQVDMRKPIESRITVDKEASNTLTVHIQRVQEGNRRLALGLNNR